MKFLYLTFFFVGCFFNRSPAYGSKADSLLSLAGKATDTTRSRLLSQAIRYFKHTQSDTLKILAWQILETSRPIKDTVGMAEAFQTLGEYYSGQGIYDSAEMYLRNSLHFYQAAGKITGEMLCSFSIGNMNDMRGENEKALDYYLNALDLAEKTGNKRYIAFGYMSIGNIYFESLNRSEDAKNYYKKSLRVFEEIGDPYASWVYHNIASVYIHQDSLDLAIENFQHALVLKEKAKDYFGISFTLNQMGKVYLGKKEFRKALDYFYAGLKLKRERNFETETIINSMENVARALIYLKQFTEAEKMLDSAEILSNTHNLKKERLLIYEVYIELFATSGNIDRAYQYQKLFIALKDSVYNEDISKQITEMQTKYESEKKEKENELLMAEKELQSSEIKQQRLIIFFILAGAILLFVLAFFIYRGYLLKKKANIELQRKNDTISKQKQEIEKQKSEIEEKNRNITDSIQYAQRIQEAILPADDILKDVFPESFIFYKPKDIVCGDFYFFARVENQLLFSVIDCTGHGVPGALMCMIANDLLHEIVSDKRVTTCSNALEDLDIKLMHVLNPGAKITNIRDGMDIAFCAFDLNRKTIQYSAANRPLLIVRDGKLIEYKADRKAIGGGDSGQKKFTNNFIETQPGDMLYLFTDGFADQIGGPKEKKFMTRQLKELLVDISAKDTGFQKAILEKTFEQWKGVGEQMDDVTVIGIRIRI